MTIYEIFCLSGDFIRGQQIPTTTITITIIIKTTEVGDKKKNYVIFKQISGREVQKHQADIEVLADGPESRRNHQVLTGG